MEESIEDKLAERVGELKKEEKKKKKEKPFVTFPRINLWQPLFYGAIAVSAFSLFGTAWYIGKKDRPIPSTPPISRTATINPWLSGEIK